MKIRHLLIAAAALCIAASAWAQLTPAKAEWGQGGVQFLMTPQEKEEWKQVKSDADADKFVKLFWLRRDPTPGTPDNEYRSDIEKRIAYADEHFTYRTTKGSVTDRGKVLLLFGVPTRVQRSGGQGTSTIAAPGRAPSASRNDSTRPDSATEEQNAEQQAWIYDGDLAQKMFGLPKVEIGFMDRFNTGDLRMTAPRFDFAAAQQKVVQASLTMPNLTLADLDKPIAPPPPPAPKPVEVPTTLKTAGLETAVADAKAGKAQSKGSAITYAELVAPNGDYFVPVALYIPKSAGLAADATDTFFLTVDDASGKRVAAVEEPSKLFATKDDFLADYTLTLPSGKYTVVAGVAKAGAPVVVSTGTLDLNTIAKDAVGTSKLILSNNITEIPEAAPVKAPFAFGKLKIVPKGDLTFTNKDELGYFVEVNNPGIDDATKMPKLQMKMDLIAAKGGRTIPSPLMDAQALPLSGAPGPGHYAIVSGIPLPELKTPLEPGDYMLKMKIVDTVTKQSYTLEQSFRIAG